MIRHLIHPRLVQKKIYVDFENKIIQQDTEIMNDIALGKTVKYYKETAYDNLKSKNKTIRD